MTEETNLYHHLLADETETTRRINEMAQTIIERYKTKNPLFICLLRGGAPFATRLMFAITSIDPTFHPEMDYMTVKTYGDERTDRPPELLADILPTTNVQGRSVILLDDVLDKGVTAKFATEHMAQKHGATNTELIVLIQKNRPRTAYSQAALYGFEAPDEWLTGMGLDDSRIAKEANRWAGYVGIAHQ